MKEIIDTKRKRIILQKEEIKYERNGTNSTETYKRQRKEPKIKREGMGD